MFFITDKIPGTENSAQRYFFNDPELLFLNQNFDQTEMTCSAWHKRSNHICSCH